MSNRLRAVEIGFALACNSARALREIMAHVAHFVDPALIRANQMDDQQQRHDDRGNLDQAIHQRSASAAARQQPSGRRTGSDDHAAVRAARRTAVRVPSSQPPVRISKG
jgi:hypothetical protein